MKYEYPRLSLLVIVIVFTEMYIPKLTVHSALTVSKRFLVVSDESEAKAIFRRIFRKQKARTHHRLVYRTKDEMLARKEICEDVGNSYVFRKDGKLSYEKYVDPLSRLIKNFRYPDVKVPIAQLSSESIETMFRCLARDSQRNVNFYVSDEYDLDTDSSDPHPLNHLVGRFIFQSFTKDWPRLYALAELPAHSFFDPDRNIESLYLKRRGSKSAGSTAKHDALCGLSKGNLQRICVAVFNSEYFAEKFQFSNVYEVKGYCEQKMVSFQTNEGKAKAAGRYFKEWMLSCEPNENESIFKYWRSSWMRSCHSADDAHKECTFDYWLTHAYHANQIFVHLRDSGSGHVFLDNLSVNVRLTYSSPKANQTDESKVAENVDTVSNRARETRLNDMPWTTDISFLEESVENSSMNKRRKVASLTKWIVTREYNF